MPSDTKTSLLEIEVAASVYYNLNVNARVLELGYTNGDDLQFIHTVKYFVDPTDGSDGLKDVCKAVFNSMRREGANPHSIFREENLRSMKIGDVVSIRFEDGQDCFTLRKNGWQRISLRLE